MEQLEKVLVAKDMDHGHIEVVIEGLARQSFLSFERRKR